MLHARTVFSDWEAQEQAPVQKLNRDSYQMENINIEVQSARGRRAVVIVRMPKLNQVQRKPYGQRSRKLPRGNRILILEYRVTFRSRDKSNDGSYFFQRTICICDFIY